MDLWIGPRGENQRLQPDSSAELLANWGMILSTDLQNRVFVCMREDLMQPLCWYWLRANVFVYVFACFRRLVVFWRIVYTKTVKDQNWCHSDSLNVSLFDLLRFCNPL